MLFYLGNMCLLYKIYMSIYWDPEKNYTGNEISELNGYTCYSNYYFPGDLTPKVTSVKASSEQLPYFTKWKALMGIYCNRDYINFFHTNQQESPSWYEVAFDNVYKISRIVVKTIYQVDILSQFKDIEILAGNSSGASDGFQNFVLIREYKPSESPTKGKLIEFIVQKEIYANHLAITSENKVLNFADLKIQSLPDSGQIYYPPLFS